MALGYMMDSFEEMTKIKIPIPLGIGLVFLAMILYFTFCTYVLFKNTKVKTGDKYVIKSGIDINLIYLSKEKYCKVK